MRDQMTSSTSALEIVLLSLMAPRQAVRSLMTSFNAKQVRLTLLAICAVVTALSALFFTWLNLSGETDPGMFIYFGPGQAVNEALVEGLVNAAVVLFSYPVGIFIWTKLFRFGDKKDNVRNAVASGVAVSVVLAPLFDALDFLSTLFNQALLSAILALSILLLGIGFTTIYYSEALSLSVGQALVKNLIATVLVVVVFAVPAIIVAIPLIANASAVVVGSGQ